MQDLNRIYLSQARRPSFYNFFKSKGYKDALTFLQSEGLSDEQIMQRTRPARGRAAQIMAHDLIALAFVQWLDGIDYNRRLMRILSD